MRGQDRPRLNALPLLLVAVAACAGSTLAVFGARSQEVVVTLVPRLTGTANPMGQNSTPPLDRPIVDDMRRMRNYPEQPPVIPHSIDGYQLTLNTNRCLDCHRREFTEGSGAPMISVTHFQDRDGQVLADVTPRRYFCTECHVQQTDARPLVPNTFVDADDVGRKR